MRGRRARLFCAAGWPASVPARQHGPLPAGGTTMGEGPVAAPLRAVAFDLDGTLANTLGLNVAAFQHAFLATTGRRYSDQEVRELCGPTQEGVIRGVTSQRWRECLALFHEFFEGHYDQLARPYPGVAELLAWIARRGLPTAIVTGAGRRCADFTVSKLGLERFIGCIETGGNEGSRKPEQLARLAGEWRIAPAQLAFVGDFLSDVTAARAAGVLPVGAAWDAAADPAALRAAGAVVVCAAPGDLHRWLAGKLGVASSTVGA
jgi:phosphoglycolate phosphatase-like HAD superfamily hydrolase